MNKDKLFWDKMANFYNKMLSSSKAYKKIYTLINTSLIKNMNILDVGCASGLVARKIAGKVNKVYAIDFSEEMIKKAKEITKEKNIDFSVQDLNKLEFEDNFFDMVVIVNVLHILKNPKAALKEIKRVLKNKGTLIAPTYIWKEISFWGKIQKFIMKKREFPIYSKWDREEYIEFLNKNGFSCTKKEIIKGSFNICYVECVLNEEK